MLFRWSIWGEKFDKCELLSHSVDTFRTCFGSSARYIVYTDEPGDVSAVLSEGAETYGYDEHPSSLFNFESTATWRKWCPAVRISEKETEIYVDNDVFIVGEPEEIRNFCTGIPGDRFLALQESEGARWCFGRFEGRVPAETPFINAGLIGQQPLADLTDNLIAEFNWWRANVEPEDVTFHDEQGAIVAALTPYIASGRVDLLSTERYRIVSPRSNPNLISLDGIALIHATHPEHPAFSWFREQICTYISNADKFRIEPVK
jgi:hypothetical protein